MKIKALSIAILIIITNSLIAQTATNFTTKDCEGVTYDLFTELDAGTVIVLCWIMPCGSCVAPAVSAYNITMGFDTTHPGRVKMYVIDDYANTSCNDLKNWCNIYGLDSTIIFSDASISMNDYGSVGMPKTVVVGGVWHKVYFNQNNTLNANLFKEAINLALTETSVKESNTISGFSASISPNPSVSEVTLEIFVENPTQAVVNVYDSRGTLISTLFEGHLVPGQVQIPLQTTEISAGLYYLRINTDSNHETLKLIVQ